MKKKILLVIIPILLFICATPVFAQGHNVYKEYDDKENLLLEMSFYSVNNYEMDYSDKYLEVTIDDYLYKQNLFNEFMNSSSSSFKILNTNYVITFRGYAIVKMFVGDVFKPGQKVNIYNYDEYDDDITHYTDDVIVNKDGFITFKIEDLSIFLITPTTNTLIDENHDYYGDVIYDEDDDILYGDYHVDNFIIITVLFVLFIFVLSFLGLFGLAALAVLVIILIVKALSKK